MVWFDGVASYGTTAGGWPDCVQQPTSTYTTMGLLWQHCHSFGIDWPALALYLQHLTNQCLGRVPVHGEDDPASAARGIISPVGASQRAAASPSRFSLTSRPAVSAKQNDSAKYNDVPDDARHQSRNTKHWTKHQPPHWQDYRRSTRRLVAFTALLDIKPRAAHVRTNHVGDPAIRVHPNRDAAGSVTDSLPNHQSRSATAESPALMRISCAASGTGAEV